MLRNRVIYIITLLVCVGASMAYVGKATHMLLFIVLLYPAAALALTAIQLALAQADFRDSRLTSPKSTEFELVIRLRNRFIFPAVPIELLCELPDKEAELFAEKRLFVSLPPLGRGEVAVKCRHRFRGSYFAVIKRLYVTDPLRIIRLSKKCGETLPVTFVPRILYMDDLLSRSAVEQSLSRKQLRSADKEDFSHVRDYRDGDIMQMVHWKLTAKQDELMIKQFDSINDLRAVILCDYDGGRDFAGMTRADMFIEASIAFAKAALDCGINSSVDLGALNEEAGAALISDMGSWNRFYELMSVLPPVLERQDLETMLDSVDMTKAAILVIITDDLSEELIEQARGAANQVAVFYVYMNFDSEPLGDDLSDERFRFLNVQGTEDDCIANAVRQLLLTSGGDRPVQ